MAEVDDWIVPEDDWIVPEEAEPTKPLKGGFAPREAREAEPTREERKGAYREMARGVRERQSTFGRYADTAGRGIARAVPFMDDIAAGLDTVTGLGRGDSYDDNLDRQRAMNEVDDTDRPGTSISGQVAGSLMLPGGRFISGGKGALSRIGRSGIVGGAYGVLSGLGSGDSMDERLSNAATGLKWGAGLGMGGAGLFEGLVGAARGVRAATAPIVGFSNPRLEAERRAAGAIGRDRALGAKALDDASFADAAAAGQGPMLIDMGGETTRRLARSASNTSEEAGQTLTSALGDRAADQNRNLGDWIGRLFSPFRSPDPEATLNRLQQRARQANQAAYGRAENEARLLVGDVARFPDGLMTPSLDRLAQTPVVQAAIGKSLKTGINEEALRGIRPNPPQSPFIRTANGYVVRPFRPGQERTLPTLQFWDQVQRNLRDVEQSAMRAGNNNAARQAGTARRQIVNELDNLVDSYREARAGAARFFGAEDALEAGEKFYAMTKRSDVAAARKALGQMSGAERALFAEGYMSAAANAANSRGDGLTASRLKMWNSPAEREKMALALGPRRTAAADAYRARAQILEWSNNAVRGNSSTAQQLAALGLGGGLVGGYLTGDLTSGVGLGTGLVVARMLTKSGMAAVDRKVANEVARILASNDPAEVGRIIARSKRPETIQKYLSVIEGQIAKVVQPEVRDRIEATQPQEYAGGGKVVKSIAKKAGELIDDLLKRGASADEIEAEIDATLKRNKDGTYVGDPGSNKSPEDIAAMRESYMEKMLRGAPGADWYHGAGKEVLFRSGDRPEMANKVAGGLGVTSANTPVDANTGFAIKGHNQAVLGDPVSTGQFPKAMGKNIERIYNDGATATGKKRGPFEENIATGGGYRQVDNPRPVHDIWDTRAWTGNNEWTGTLGEAQHEFLDKNAAVVIARANERGLGGRNDWDALRSQAAPWIAEMAEKRGIPIEQAAKHYGDFFPKYDAQLSWESMPGKTTDHLPELHGAPFADKQAYHDEMKRIVLDEKGRDRIGLGFDMLTGKSIDGPGFYEGNVNPGTQSHVAVGRVTDPDKTVRMDPSSERLVQGVEGTRGTLLAQDGIAYHALGNAGQAAKRANAFELPMGGPLSNEQAFDVDRALRARFGENAPFAIVPSRNGVRLIHFGDPSPEVAKMVKGIAKDIGAGEPTLHSTTGSNLIENNWREQRLGETYHPLFDDEKYPHLQRSFDKIAPEISQRLLELDKSTGGTQSKLITEMRKAIANEGLAGLRGLVKKGYAEGGRVEANSVMDILDRAMAA